MAEATLDDGVIRTVDGVPLKQSLRQTTRMNRLKAVGLVLPLFAFIMITFIIPIADMLFRSVDNPEVIDTIPRTVEKLKAWDGNGVPGEDVFKTMAEEFAVAHKNHSLGKMATRLNYADAGMRSLISKTGRHAAKLEAPYKEAMIKLDKKWGENATWTTIKQLSSPYTASYYLAAVDHKFNPQGEIVSVPSYQRIYVPLFIRTLWVSLLITVLCILLGYPIAFLMANQPTRIANLLMILVLLPFWTSLLVRTTAWIVMLQSQGVLNDVLVWLGILSNDGRVQMVYNMTGTIVAMTHILLPFMVLPLYSVMKTIPPSYMRAAQSLGATPARAFWKVYAPNTVPGIGAGSLLVFILSIGYYITPALVGGRTGQLISNMIAYHMQQSLNWGLAAALGTLLLAGVLMLYLIYNRIVGIDNMKLG